jgi:hypothetical protein
LHRFAAQYFKKDVRDASNYGKKNNNPYPPHGLRAVPDKVNYADHLERNSYVIKVVYRADFWANQIYIKSNSFCKGNPKYSGR